MSLTKQIALLVIDVQNDFLPSGALAVPQGDRVLAPINRLIERHEHIILTQDWHPANHSCFATMHPQAQEFAEIDFPYGPQILWPQHCVQGSFGAAFSPLLNTQKAELILRKGYRAELDSYSAFFENDHKTPTGLNAYLKERNITQLLLCGLATDFCVAYSALDAVKCGFEVSVALDACAAIDLNGSLDKMLKTMIQNGVELLMVS